MLLLLVLLPPRLLDLFEPDLGLKDVPLIKGLAAGIATRGGAGGGGGCATIAEVRRAPENEEGPVCHSCVAGLRAVLPLSEFSVSASLSPLSLWRLLESCSGRGGTERRRNREPNYNAVSDASGRAREPRAQASSKTIHHALGRWLGLAGGCLRPSVSRCEDRECPPSHVAIENPYKVKEKVYLISTRFIENVFRIFNIFRQTY